MAEVAARLEAALSEAALSEAPWPLGPAVLALDAQG